MDPFGWTPEQYTAAGTWVMVVILAVTARFAAGQVKQAAAARQDQSRPFVVPSIDVEQQMLFVLKVENVGKTPAFNVLVQFAEPPRSTLKEIEEVRMLKEPIPTMPPGQKFRAYWESALTVFSTETPYAFPMSYTVLVSYDDLHGHHFGPEGYVLDFRVFEGQATGPKGVPDLVKAVEKMAAEQHKWTDGTRGLRVRSWDGDKETRRDNRPWHIRKARQAWKSDGVWAGVLYWIDYWRRRYGFWSR